MSIKIKRSRFTKSFHELTYVDKEKIKSSFIYEVLFEDLPINEETWLKIQAKWQELQNDKTEYERVRRQSSKWKLARDKYRKSSKGKKVGNKIQNDYRERWGDVYRKRQNEVHRNSPRIQKWIKEYQAQPINRITARLRTRLYSTLKESGKVKEQDAFELFGCTKQELFSHVEKQFLKDMNWKNLGSWHLDHIVPIKYFRDNYDLTDLNIQKICFHFSNLQPIWSKHNLSKGDKVNPLFAEKKIAEIKKLINA